MKSLIRTFPVILLLLGSVFLLGACEGEEEETFEDNPEAYSTVNPPPATMALPASLTGASTTAASTRALTNAVVSDPAQCDFGDHKDPFANGYTLTKFLVGISQSTNCLADFLIFTITAEGKKFVGKGIQATGNPAGTDEPTHFKIEKSDGGKIVQVWLFSDGLGVTPDVYFTWTTSDGTDASGQMIMLGDGVDPEEPDKIRTDFSRSAGLNTNNVTFSFPAANDLTGFRSQVVASGAGGAVTYEAKGYLGLNAPIGAENLPTTEIFANSALSAVAVADANGLGAAIANFQNIAIHLGIPDEAGAPLANLGSYQITLTDRSYFTGAGAQEWLWKGPTVATYVNTSGGNVRSGADPVPGGGGVTWLQFFLDCLKSAAGCTDPNTGEVTVPGLALGAGYFTDPCSDTNGANCLAFWQGLYTNGGGWGGATPNTPTAEPAADFRQAKLNAAVQFTSVFPAGQDATTYFVIPAP